MNIYDGNWTDEQWGAALGKLGKENAQLRQELEEATRKIGELILDGAIVETRLKETKEKQHE